MAFNFCLDCIPCLSIPDGSGCGITRRGGIKKVWALPCNVQPVNGEIGWPSILNGVEDEFFGITYKDPTTGAIRNTFTDDGLENTLEDLYKAPKLPANFPISGFKPLNTLSSNIVGGIGNSTPNTAQLSGCAEPEVYSVTHTIELDFPKSFSDGNVDIIDFWPKIKKGAGNWTLLIERCDGRAMVIPTGTWGITGIKNTDPISNKEIRMRGISITYTSDEYFIGEYTSPVLDQLI